jgi:hypothetical protein
MAIGKAVRNSIYFTQVKWSVPTRRADAQRKFLWNILLKKLGKKTPKPIKQCSFTFSSKSACLIGIAGKWGTYFGSSVKHRYRVFGGQRPWKSWQLVCCSLSIVPYPLHIVVTWLILPVVICLSQRLSHACLSINKSILWNCEWLIKSVIVYLIVPYYLDNRGNSRANTCLKTRLLEGLYLLDKKPTRATAFLVIHNNFSNRMAFTPTMVHSNFCPINFRW